MLFKHAVILDTAQEQMVADIMMYRFLVNAGTVHIPSNETYEEALNVTRLVDEYMVCFWQGRNRRDISEQAEHYTLAKLYKSVDNHVQ